MERSINALRGHVILCGYGRNGKAAAAILEQHNKLFVVIEKHYAEKGHTQYYLNHDATTEEALIQAGIHNASALITTLPQDAENLYIVLTARELNPALKIISRASDDNAVKKMKTAGADNVIMPDKIGGAHMATLITNPDVKEFMDALFTQGLDGTIIQELGVSKSIALSELDPWRNTGATLLGIKNASGKYTTNPTPTESVKAGDKIMVMGTKEQIAALSRLLS